MAAYDKNVDYSDLIAAEAAKGVNADKQLLAELEAARNAKIAGENLDYAQTNVYTQEFGTPPHYYTAEDHSDYINEIYAAAERQALSALEGAYREQLAAYDSEAAALRTLLPALESWVPGLVVGGLLCVGLAVSFRRENVIRRMETVSPKPVGALLCGGLLAWAVVSFSSTATFIYSNF